MSFFDVDFREQVKMLLPPIMRSTTIIDYLSALTEPLTTLASTNKPFYDEQLIIAKATSQKMVLQEVLNDLMGITASPYIYITFSRTLKASSYIFQEGEGIIWYVWAEGEFSVQYVLTEAEVAALSNIDFTVNIPNALGTEGEDRVTELVNQLKAPGVKFDTNLYV